MQHFHPIFITKRRIVYFTLLVSLVLVIVFAKPFLYTSAVSESPADVIVMVHAMSQEELNHYAYMDYASASYHLKPIILEARRRIIFQQPWVADGVQGRELDADGNVVKVLPEFHDLFPEDWDIPVSSTEVDLSYYGK